MHGERTAAVRGLILSAMIVLLIISVSPFPKLQLQAPFRSADGFVTATARLVTRAGNARKEHWSAFRHSRDMAALSCRVLALTERSNAVPQEHPAGTAGFVYSLMVRTTLEVGRLSPPDVFISLRRRSSYCG